MERHEYVLNNKMRVILLPQHSLPIVEAQGWVRAGAALSSRRLVGSAVLRMLTRGTDVRNRDQFNDALDKYGLIYEARPSEFSPFFAEWGGRAMKHHIGELLWLVYESLHLPSFSEEEFELVKRRWESQVRNRASDPALLASEEIPRMIFGPLHPSHWLSTEEVMDQLRALTVDDLRDFWNKHYVPDRSGIVLVGNFDTDEMYELVKFVFENWNRMRQYYMSITPSFDTNDYAHNQDYEEKVRFVPEKSNAVLAIGQAIAMPNSNHPDYPALMLGIKALGGGPHARLFQHVRERCGFSYSVYARLEDMHDAPGYFMARAHTNPENMPKTQEETWRVITEFCEHGITQEELDQEKTTYKGNKAVLLSSRKGLGQEVVSDSILNRSMEAFAETVAGLTLEEVNQAIKQHLNLLRMKVVRAGTIE